MHKGAKTAAQSERVRHWDAIEAAAKQLLHAMEAAARDPDWPDEDIERFDELHDAVTRRPRLSVPERDRLTGRFQPPEQNGNGT